MPSAWKLLIFSWFHAALLMSHCFPFSLSSLCTSVSFPIVILRLFFCCDGVDTVYYTTWNPSLVFAGFVMNSLVFLQCIFHWSFILTRKILDYLSWSKSSFASIFFTTYSFILREFYFGWILFWNSVAAPRLKAPRFRRISHWMLSDMSWMVFKGHCLCCMFTDAALN